ncbi:MAG: bifunctional nuclease family protein [Candidatus Omnitrophota bacterium]
MIEMELNKIIIDEKKHDQVIVLKEKNGERLMPIIIGLNEVSSIKMKLTKLTPPRPLTHDLLKLIIDSLEAKVEKVVIDKIEQGTFHAKIFLRTNDGKNKILDARPSDSIALALRTQSSIFVEEDVLDKTEITKK